MTRKIRLGGMLVAALLACVFVFAACGESANTAVQQKQETRIASALQRLEAAEPTPTLLDSADRAIQSNYYTAEADPNKIWYLETLAMTGSVEASYTIRGPVEPAGDELTNPDQLTCTDSEHGACGVIGLAEPNGIYEHDTNDHIARLTDGALLRFEGQYQVSDQPFTVKTPETISVNGNAEISHTNLADTKGGTLPPR